jgi:hypothetical protein
MSSATAMQKHAGGVAEYRASEGKHVHVPCKGPVQGTVLDILGGLRSACTYVGASHLRHLSKCTTFIRVTQQTNEVWAGQPGEESKASPPPPAAATAASTPPSSTTVTESKSPISVVAATPTSSTIVHINEASVVNPQVTDMVSTPFDPTVSLEDVRQMMGNFAKDRNWAQYHTPRNLALGKFNILDTSHAHLYLASLLYSAVLLSS